MGMNSMRFKLALLSSVLLAACGGGEPTSTQDDGVGGNTGTITVRIEEVGGIFVEGFEVGLRFETGDGEVIATTLWSDFVNSQPDGDFYTSVLEQPVPAGDVVVLASANVGIGPPPEVPDVDGDLRCRLPVTVTVGGTAAIEVTFDDPDNCLRLV